MKFAIITPLLALTLITGSALADSKFYWGANLASSEFDSETGFSLDTTGIGLKFGREFGDYIDVEAHLGFGSDNSEDLGDPELTYGGAFVKFNLPFEKVSLYVMGGATKVDIDTNTVSGDDEEPGIGGGLELYGGENTAFVIEFMRYGDDNSVDSVSFGIVHRFNFPRLR